MVADALHALLEVQALDTRADQLARRRATLPERGALATAEASVRSRSAELDVLTGRAHELERAQKRAEDEIASLEEKARATDRQLYSGSVTAPRELQALQDEAASIRRRIGLREDDVLTGMEELEPVAAEVARLQAARDEASTTAEALREAIAGQEASIDAELAEVASGRMALVAAVPESLVAQYERIRARAGGVGIARLDGHRCTGCHLELPNREVDELRRAAPDAIVLHDECGRILVRD
jgi:predicted  nucleic acid-binding Zn-ribbon protein